LNRKDFSDRLDREISGVKDREVSEMEDRRLERFYLSLFKKSERKWRRIVWQANKKRYGNTPWDFAKKYGREWSIR